MARYLFLLILALFFGNPSSANQTPSACERAFLMEMLSDHYYDPCVYQKGLCSINAGELARQIKQAYHSSIKFDQLKILIIYHRDLSSLTVEDPLLEHTLAGRSLRSMNSMPILWRHHAVLEYQGEILDLDFGPRAQAVPLKAYFNLQFPETQLTFRNPDSIQSENRELRVRTHNTPDDLRILAIPAMQYLSLFPSGRPKISKIEQELNRIFSIGSSETLDQLIGRSNPEAAL